MISYQISLASWLATHHISSLWKLKIPLWNCNSITIIQQHLNIMQSTYKLLTSDFVELQNDFLQLFQWVPPRA